MIANLLVFLLIIGLIVLFGWLTYRAFRAKKLWIKIVGGIGAGLLTLLFVVVGFMGAKGMAATYFPGADPAPALKAAGTPEQIARREYLVNLSCIGCHSAVGPDGAPTGEHPLTGGWNIAQAEGFGFIGDGEPPPPAPAIVTAPPQGVNAEYGKYVATFGECRGCHGPDATGAPATSVSPAVPNPRPLVASMTQEQFAAMMRSGVRPGGAAFPDTMPWQNAAQMTDSDLAALYAYLTATP